MKIEYKNINEALNFYDIIEEKYKEKCYQCIEKINESTEISRKFSRFQILVFIFHIQVNILCQCTKDVSVSSAVSAP